MTQETNAHIHVVPYDPFTASLRHDIFLRLTGLEPDVAQIHRLRAAEDDYSTLLKDTESRVRRGWDDVLPLIHQVLSRAGLRTTPVITPCRFFGQADYTGYKVCLSWISDDDPETVGDLWLHLAQCHSSPYAEPHAANVSLKETLARHRVIHTGAEL